MPLPLALIHDSRVIPLTGRAVQIGRLAECDLLLDGAAVSRRHARIVPTPSGPLIVDRSRFGTLVNGTQVIAPQLLHEGDVIQIGPWTFDVVQASGATAGIEEDPLPSAWRHRLVQWQRRYGLSEVTGTIAAVAVAVLTARGSGSVILAGYAGSVAEMLWFYGVLAVHDLRRESREAATAGHPGEPRAVTRVLRNLVAEFGRAEALDALLLRPLCLASGLRLIGGPLGALAGKLGADALFYGPVLRLVHWRLSREAVEPAHEVERRRRETTANALPLLRPPDGDPR